MVSVIGTSLFFIKKHYSLYSTLEIRQKRGDCDHSSHLDIWNTEASRFKTFPAFLAAASMLSQFYSSRAVLLIWRFGWLLLFQSSLLVTNIYESGSSLFGVDFEFSYWFISFLKLLRRRGLWSIPQLTTRGRSRYYCFTCFCRALMASSCTYSQCSGPSSISI